MIKLTSQGRYRLIETKTRAKILTLDGQPYHWRYAEGIGDLLVFSRRSHRPSHALAQGTYRIFRVKNEPKFADLEHLELSIGGTAWQGYLLLTGLPDPARTRRRIVPTDEVISTLPPPPHAQPLSRPVPPLLR